MLVHPVSVSLRGKGKFTHPNKKDDNLNDSGDIHLDASGDVKQTILDWNISEFLGSRNCGLEDYHNLFKDGTKDILDSVNRLEGG